MEQGPHATSCKGKQHNITCIYQCLNKKSANKAANAILGK